jgi:hypothetical protein
MLQESNTPLAGHDRSAPLYGSHRTTALRCCICQQLCPTQRRGTGIYQERNHPADRNENSMMRPAQMSPGDWGAMWLRVMKRILREDAP